jgi:hypothetical protein
VIVYAKQGVRVAELHFRESATPPPVDVVRYLSRAERVRGTRCSEFPTIHIDLAPEPEQLLAAMSKTTRNEIRRAEREGGVTCEFQIAPSLEWAEAFLEFNAAFAREKKLVPAGRDRVLGMRESSSLALSRVVDADGAVVVWHSYVHGDGTARLLHSCSLFRNVDKAKAGVVSRSNRLLHWADMQRLREAGFHTYDFGGWYAGKDDEAKLRINFFKEGFGGAVTTLYNIEAGMTLKGVAVIRLRHAIDRFRGEA